MSEAGSESHNATAVAKSDGATKALTVVLTRRQYELLHMETMSAIDSADRAEDVAAWTVLHAGLSSSRWRVPLSHINAAVMYCLGMVDATEDAGVRRSFAAVHRKLAAKVAVSTECSSR